MSKYPSAFSLADFAEISKVDAKDCKDVFIDLSEAFGTDKFRRFWREFLVAQDRYFGKFEGFAKNVTGPAQRTFDRVKYWRSARCGGIVNYLMHSRNRDVHVGPGYASLPQHALMKGPLADLFGDVHVDADIVVEDCRLVSGEKDIPISGFFEVNKGKIVQATGDFSHAEEFGPYLRLGSFPDRTGAIVELPRFPKFVEREEIPIYFSAYTLDLIDYSHSELLSSVERALHT